MGEKKKKTLNQKVYHNTRTTNVHIPRLNTGHNPRINLISLRGSKYGLGRPPTKTEKHRNAKNVLTRKTDRSDCEKNRLQKVRQKRVGWKKRGGQRLKKKVCERESQ